MFKKLTYEEREEIQKIVSNEFSFSKIKKELHRFSVTPINHSITRIGYDCQIWAFTNLGLLQYIKFDGTGIDVCAKLRKGEIPELEKTENLEDTTLLAYCHSPDFDPSMSHTHYAVCRIENNHTAIFSKWGAKGHVYRQDTSIWSLPMAYGNRVELFKVKR